MTGDGWAAIDVPRSLVLNPWCVPEPLLVYTSVELFGGFARVSFSRIYSLPDLVHMVNTDEVKASGSTP